MAKMKFKPADDAKDTLWGPLGTPERDAMEAQHAYFVGEAIRKARLQQKITQEQLGERIGVKRSQICKLESGKSSMTLSTMGRVFRALGFATATLDLGSGGKVNLW